MNCNTLSPKEREFIDNLVGGEKYDTVYTYVDDQDVAYYIASVDGEISIYSQVSGESLTVVGDYYSTWVQGFENTELDFIKIVHAIAPLEKWAEEALDINHL